MKIVVFDAVSDVYGSSRICRLCVQLLGEAGHQVDVFVREEHLQPEARYGQQCGFPLLVMSTLRARPLRFVAELLGALVRFWRRSGQLLAGVDLVYCNTFGTLPVAFVARLRGRRTVIHVHETPSSRLVAVVGRAFLRVGGSQIVCVSGAVLRAWGLERATKARVVYNGIPEAVGVPVTGSRGFDLAFVGRLTDRKGFDVFLDALETFERQGEALRVVVAGGALPGKGTPEGLARARSYRHVSVTYLGEVSDGSAVFAQAKVACIPSRFADPFPTVVLEALRAGCAVIATATGGAPEALEGSEADLVPPGDRQALVLGVRRQLERWRREDVCGVSQRVFRERFTLERFRERFLSLPCWGAGASTRADDTTVASGGNG